MNNFAGGNPIVELNSLPICMVDGSKLSLKVKNDLEQATFGLS
jgi:hypothetical protein